MKSLTAVRKKSPNYPVEFKIKMVELSHRPEISVAQLAREHGINDNLLFKWRQYWREGKLRPPSTTENNVPELLPITLDGTVAKLAMRQPFVLFKGLTFQKLCLPGAFRPGDHHNK
ncbi:transposase, partial [Escherichia coli]|uniref:transposase n=1 Tax=Escherichia coli TaxID=562 RepID=UPI003F7618FC